LEFRLEPWFFCGFLRIQEAAVYEISK